MAIVGKELGVIGQVRVAAGHPVALVVGMLLGGFVPVATYLVAHGEAGGWSLASALVLGGLIYSAKTVWAWGRMAFGCSFKATGFVLLIEGVMITSKTPALAIVALLYLVAINAVATGSLLALRDGAAARPAKPKAEPKAVEAKAKAEVIAAKEERKPARKRSSRAPKAPRAPVEASDGFDFEFISLPTGNVEVEASADHSN
jgi:hypothetical protein